MLISNNQLLLLKSIYVKREHTFHKNISALIIADRDLYLQLRQIYRTKNIKIGQQVFDLIYPNHTKICMCGNAVKFDNDDFVYRKHCSSKCANNDEKSKTKSRETCMKKFGVSNGSQANCVKLKKIKTCLKNYGVEYPQQNKNVRDLSKKTLICNYGVSNPSKSKEIQDKKIATSIIKYGFSNPMHNGSILHKAQRNAHRVKSTDIGGKTFQFMGYEDIALRYFINVVQVNVESIHTFCTFPDIFYYDDYKDMYRKYTPDILFHHRSISHIVEVKSTWTLGLFHKSGATFANWEAKAKAASKLKTHVFRTMLIHKQQVFFIKHYNRAKLERYFSKF